MGIDEFRELVGTVYSNFDHEIEESVVPLLNEKTYAYHTAVNYCGDVYRVSDKWFEDIYQYGRHVDTLHADSLGEVIEKAVNEWGRH